MLLRRGDICLVDFGKIEGLTSKQLGVRPSLVVSNRLANEYSPVISVVPISARIHKAKLPTHVVLKENDGLEELSFAMAEQIQTVDKSSIIKVLAHCTEETMNRLNKAVMIQLGLIEIPRIQIKVS